MVPMESVQLLLAVVVAAKVWLVHHMDVKTSSPLLGDGTMFQFPSSPFVYQAVRSARVGACQSAEKAFHLVKRSFEHCLFDIYIWLLAWLLRHRHVGRPRRPRLAERPFGHRFLVSTSAL